MLVTTLSFTAPAILEYRSSGPLMELKDYSNLKQWLNRYL